MKRRHEDAGPIESKRTCLAGRRFAFVGFDQYTCTEAQQLVRDYGGETMIHWSESTDYIVVGGDKQPFALEWIESNGKVTVDCEGLRDFVETEQALREQEQEQRDRDQDADLFLHQILHKGGASRSGTLVDEDESSDTESQSDNELVHPENDGSKRRMDTDDRLQLRHSVEAKSDARARFETAFRKDAGSLMGNTAERTAADHDHVAGLQVQEIPNPNEELSCTERKRLILCDTPSIIMTQMAAWVSMIQSLLEPNILQDECWIHTTFQRYRNGSTIAKSFNWKGSSGPIKVRLHYAAVARFVEGTLSDADKEGIIEHSWHASHLCGNWTCCNLKHITFEDGSTNSKRNRCFAAADSCKHSPPCMKEKKLYDSPLVPKRMSARKRERLLTDPNAGKGKESESGPSSQDSGYKSEATL